MKRANTDYLLADKRFSIAMQTFELKIMECDNLAADKCRAEIHALTDMMLDYKASILMLAGMLSN